MTPCLYLRCLSCGKPDSVRAARSHLQFGGTGSQPLLGKVISWFTVLHATPSRVTRPGKKNHETTFSCIWFVRCARPVFERKWCGRHFGEAGRDLEKAGG